jgi:hypothetical protein
VAWLTRLFKAIEFFVDHAYKKPIWIVSTLICSSCLTFIASYQLSRPEEQARFENAANELRVDVEDTERLINLYKEILAENEPSTKAIGQFSSIIHDINTSGRWTDRKQQIEENYHLAVETRKRVEIIIAKLQGTNFRVPYLNEDVRALKGFLTTLTSALKLIEELYVPYLIGDVEKFAQHMLQSEIRIEGIDKEQKTGLAQMESQSWQKQSAVRLKKLELDKTFEQAERHRNIGLLQIPAVIFSVGYIIFIYRGVRKFLKKSGRGVLGQKRVIPMHKKRRKKR